MTYETSPAVSHWVRWHEAYDDPDSPTSRRLRAATESTRVAVSAAPAGEVRILSLCAGLGLDVIGALADHPRRAETKAMLVELDPALAEGARSNAQEAGLSDRVTVVEGDAGLAATFAPAIPVDVLLLCGIFGNISDADIAATVAAAPALCRPEATVIWTRHRREPDLTPAIRQWFNAAGFVEREVSSEGPGGFLVGTGRLAQLADERPQLDPASRLFSFVTGATT